MLTLATDSVWAPLLAALVGAFIGGLGGQAMGHMLSSGRERRQKLREAYAAFGAACFRFLDVKQDHIVLTKRDEVLTARRLQRQVPGGSEALDEAEAQRQGDWERAQERARQAH